MLHNPRLRNPGVLSLLLLFLFLGLIQLAAGQETDNLLLDTELLTFEAPAIQPCLVHLPADYKPGRAYPLVVGLHGFGGNIDRFHTNWFAFDNPQFIYACPQAPYPTVQTFGIGFGWFLHDTGDPELERTVISLSHDYALDVIQQLQQQYNVSEVYLLGFSQGAMLSLLLAMENPEHADGIGFFSSRIDPWLVNRLVLEGLPDTFRVFAVHGTFDDVAEFQDGIVARDLLRAAGLDVTWKEFEGGHTIMAEDLRGFQGWMEQNPAPADEN